MAERIITELSIFGSVDYERESRKLDEEENSAGWEDRRAFCLEWVAARVCLELAVEIDCFGGKKPTSECSVSGVVRELFDARENYIRRARLKCLDDWE